MLLLGASGLAPGTAKETGPAGPFGVALVHFEQNVTDGDSEVVFEVKAGKEGLARLVVTAPDGRTVVDFTAPDASTLGIRQFRFETPEPRDLQALRSAYPEGVYTFAGVATAVGSSAARPRCITRCRPRPRSSRPRPAPRAWPPRI